MPIVAFTFGSFGDITAILQLAWTIRQSLSETGGAVAQVQTLITDIDTFTRALQQIKSALETRASVPADLMNGVSHALEESFQLLTRVKARIEAFNAQVAGAVGRNVLRKYWAALGWEILGGKREVDALRTRLSDQVEVIQTLIAAAHSQNLEEIRKSAAAHSQKLDDVRKDAENTHRNVGEMFASMRELCIRLSATSAPFTFFDASGAQLLPVGVMRMAIDYHGFWNRGLRKSTDRPLPVNGVAFAKLTIYYRRNYVYILDGNPLSKVLGENPWDTSHLVLLVFSYRDGDEEVSFVSPVYGTSRDCWQSVLFPEASAALSEYLRCNSNRRVDVNGFRRVFADRGGWPLRV